MSTQKLSITVETAVAKALEAKIAPRKLSQFVNRAIRHELERERLRELLGTLEEKLGPPDEQLMREARTAFEQAEAAAETPRTARRSTRANGRR